MPQYTALSIIFNPHSTGNSKQLARDLQQKLRRQNPSLSVKLVPTRHAGHAETLAYDLAKASQRPLIISSSGDGGYHEVINGLIRAQQEGAQPTAGLLPAGNANDHFQDMHEHDLSEAIAHNAVQTIDLLKFSYVRDGRAAERYAHSYIGLGLTPQAGKELNKHRLNLLLEAWVVLRILFFLRPVRLLVQHKVQAYDSLVFSNIGRMSKVLSLSEIASATDGKFEITAFRRRNKLRLIASLLKASTKGLQGTHQAKAFVFNTTQSTLVQLDGEIITIDANSTARVTIEPTILRCIL